MRHPLVKKVFLPASLMALLFFIAGNILNNLRLAFLPQGTVMLQALSAVPILLLGIILWALADRISFELLFKRTLQILIGLLVLSWILFFVRESVGESARFFNWVPPFFYIIATLLNTSLFTVLVWGSVNQVIQVSEGMKFYIPFAFALMVITILAKLLSLPLARASFSAILLTALALLVCALSLFHWAWGRLTKERTLSKKKEGIRNFPFLSSAYLFGGLVIAQSFSGILFKAKTRAQFGDAAGYIHSMAQYSKLAGGIGLIFALFWLFFGTKSLQKKGWPSLLIHGVGTVLILTGIYLGLSLIGDSTVWINSLFIGGLRGTEAILFFPLIHMLFLMVPQKSRFRVQALVLLVLFPLIRGLGALITQGLLIRFKSVEAIGPYLLGLLIIALLLLIPAAKKLIQRYKTVKI